MDRWALSELHATTAEVTEALEGFDSLRAGRRLSTLIDDLSNWYVRTNRRRFWEGDPAALSTLHQVLEGLTLLMAPFTPFLAEALHDALVPGADSVHLRSWPAADPSLVSAELSAQVALTRRLVDLGRTARAESKTKTRQPLGRALVSAQGWSALPGRAARPRRRRAERAGDGAAVRRPRRRDGQGQLPVLGARFGKGVQSVAAAVAAADAAELSAALRAGTAAVTVDGSPVPLSAEEVIVTETPRSGWAVASGAGETVALDLEITPELRRAGLLRDVVRLVQEARKASGLDVSDRIELWWDGSGDVVEALREGTGRLGGGGPRCDRHRGCARPPT